MHKYKKKSRKVNFQRDFSCIWAASCDRNFGGMLENSFEHSEIRIAFQQAASEVLQKMHKRKKNEQKFIFK